MGLFTPKCFFCRKPFPSNKVEKHVKVSTGEWKKCCYGCASVMGTKPKKPGLTSSGQIRRVRGTKPGDQGTLW